MTPVGPRSVSRDAGSRRGSKGSIAQGEDFIEPKAIAAVAAYLADRKKGVDIRGALLDHSGSLGGVLDAAIAFEGREEPRSATEGAEFERWNGCYVEAMSWANSMSKLLEV